MWHTSVGKWLSGRFFFFRLFLSEVRSSRQIFITFFFFFFFFFFFSFFWARGAGRRIAPLRTGRRRRRRRRRQGVIGATGVTGAVRRRQGVIGATAPLAPSGAVRRLQAPQGVAPPGAVRRHQAGAFSFGLLQAPSALRPLLASEIPEHLS